MNLKINSSDKMSNIKSICQEDRVIRLSMFLRDSYNLKVGDLLSFTGKNNELITLLIEKAFRKEAEEKPDVAYVTDNTLQSLDIQKGRTHIPIVDNITLGADPEFFIVEKGSKAIATAALFFKKWGPIGHDGMMAEIRPQPSTCPDMLTNTIFQLLSNAKRIVDDSGDKRNLMLYGASQHNKLAAGFHIHFGLPPALLGENPAKKPIYQQIVKILDYYVGIPCVIAEGEVDSARRCAPFVSYGKVGDYRIDMTTFEYRVPGGNMLRHPILTRGLLTLSALVMEDIVSRIRAYTDNFVNMHKLSTQQDVTGLYDNVPTIEELFSTICVPYVGAAREQLPKIRQDLSDMLGYLKYANIIDEFFRNLETAFGHDINQNWQLPELKSKQITV